MAKKKGILSALFGGVGGKKSGRSRASKARSKPSSSKGKSAASKSKPKTKTAPKNSVPKSKVQTKKPPRKATQEDKKPLVRRFIAVLEKQKKQKQKRKARNEFRFNHDTKHMNYVYEEVGDEYKSIGLTTKGETFGRKNMPLKKNPKKGDTGDSYIRNGSIKDNKKSYSKKVAKNYQFSKEDMANVKSKIRHHKKNEKKKRQ